MDLDLSPETWKLLHEFKVQQEEEDVTTKAPKLEEFPILNPEISYREFFENFLIRNRLCLFKRGLTKIWGATTEWIKKGEGQEDEDINFEMLCKRFGKCKVTVTHCIPQEQLKNLNGYGNEKKEEMIFKDFIEYWMTQRSESDDGDSNNLSHLYLKDWHIVKDCQNYSQPMPYETPTFFTSDWLNEDSETKDDDYKFAYFGVKGSWTPFHADVFGSFSWSANIIGRKLWRIYPRGYEKSYISSATGRIDYNYESPGILGQDFYEIVQNSGEIIFIPSGFHHIVWNLSDVISINHNWFNGANIGFIWVCLQKGLELVKKELEGILPEDDEEYLSKTQLILLSNHGMNYSSFLHLLERISNNRNKSSNINSNHVQFDLYSINLVLNEMQSNIDYKELINVNHEGIKDCFNRLKKI